MKNYNYNLLKLLHELSDISWRIDKHCEGDAQNLDCDCPKILQTIKESTRQNAELILKEIKKHNQDKDLDA